MAIVEDTVVSVNGSVLLPPQDEEESSVGSTEALCELLGIQSLDVFPGSDDDIPTERGGDSAVSRWPCQCQSLDDLMQIDDNSIASILADHQAVKEWSETSVCVFPDELSVPAAIMRRLSDELVWCGGSSTNESDKDKMADRTYETIQVYKNGAIHDRRVLTRLEHITKQHEGWNMLCHEYIRRCLSLLLGHEMVLFKTKLNLKPAGGSGFAPHVDAPSLRMALGDEGPQTFVTVMVAIDTMTEQNGCLSVVRSTSGHGELNETNACPTIAPQVGANPDAGGRAGAIAADVADTLDFANLCCVGGTIVAFNGWVPHKSACNQSSFARRAVFITYNPASEGDFHDAYYERMALLRRNWRQSVGLGAHAGKTTTDSSNDHIDPMELSALATIPRI